MDTLKRLFTIQEISKQLEISKSTLRFYERVFEGLLTPHRTSGGQRRYSATEVRVLQQIQRLKSEGMSLNGIRLELQRTLAYREQASDLYRVDALAAKIACLVKNEISSFLEETNRTKAKD